MNAAQFSRLSGRYLEALKIHVEPGCEAGSQTPQELGNDALAIGLETLDLARIHDRALTSLIMPGSSSEAREDLTRRAAAFFTEAILPIEATHSSALEAASDWDRLNSTLKQRTQDLADSNRELHLQITGRKTSEDAFNKSKLASSQLLDDSQALEEHLQNMTRRIITATEDGRKKMRLQLSDEIVQALLGIQLRMLALKNVIASHDEIRSKEIAMIQHLVESSSEIVNRLAHEFGT